jgi:hypothetical protein
MEYSEGDMKGKDAVKKRKRRSSRLAVSTFNRFKQKEKVS